jgi:hypothetical protein
MVVFDVSAVNVAVGALVYGYDRALLLAGCGFAIGTDAAGLLPRGATRTGTRELGAPEP